MHKTVKLLQEGHVGLLVMEEREHKNTFSWDFIKDLQETFEFINNDSDFKVVVVSGYDSYFCCGGTKEELLGIADGKFQFSDVDIHDLFLRCRLPVISAMGGHALGGGLALGCYADVIILAEECVYSANFMRYGFTPDMGASYIIPLIFGEALGWEMLLSARNYSGRELKARGAPVKIVPMSLVLETALEIARELAEKPLLSLELLKWRLTRKTKAELPETIDRELEMHRLTFAQPEVRDRIEDRFGN